MCFYWAKSISELKFGKRLLQPATTTFFRYVAAAERTLEIWMKPVTFSWLNVPFGVCLQTKFLFTFCTAHQNTPCVSSRPSKYVGCISFSLFLFKTCMVDIIFYLLAVFFACALLRFTSSRHHGREFSQEVAVQKSTQHRLSGDRKILRDTIKR